MRGPRHVTSGALAAAAVARAALSGAAVAEGTATRCRGEVAADHAAALAALNAEGRPERQPDADGTTALLWAVHHNDVDLVKQLLAAGADVEGGERVRRDADVGSSDRRGRRRCSKRCSAPAPTSSRRTPTARPRS